MPTDLHATDPRPGTRLGYVRPGMHKIPDWRKAPDWAVYTYMQGSDSWTWVSQFPDHDGLFGPGTTTFAPVDDSCLIDADDVNN